MTIFMLSSVINTLTKTKKYLFTVFKKNVSAVLHT